LDVLNQRGLAAKFPLFIFLRGQIGEKLFS